jgi:hypothetical protein
MAASPIPPPDEPNAAHVPITEEFDSLKHTMPNAAPLIISMLLVAAVVGILAYVLRATPVATGSVTDAAAVSIPGQNTAIAIVNLNFQNVTDKPLRLQNINIAVHAKGSDFNDDFGSATDFPRYFEAFPALQEHAQPGLFRDAGIAPKQTMAGSVIVALPLTQEEFDARDSITATLKFEDHPAVKLTSRKK